MLKKEGNWLAFYELIFVIVVSPVEKIRLHAVWFAPCAREPYIHRVFIF